MPYCGVARHAQAYSWPTNTRRDALSPLLIPSETERRRRVLFLGFKRQQRNFCCPSAQTPAEQRCHGPALIPNFGTSYFFGIFHGIFETSWILPIFLIFLLIMRFLGLTDTGLVFCSSLFPFLLYFPALSAGVFHKERSAISGPECHKHAKERRIF